MKSRHLFGILLALALLCAALSGCGGPSAEQPTGVPVPTWRANEAPDATLPYMIQVGDTIYTSTGKMFYSINVEDSEILGYLAYTGDNHIRPQNGEGNFPAAEGAPYAHSSSERYPGLIVRYPDGGWAHWGPEESAEEP